MFCPQCGSNQSDELRFCKLCGANLAAVRQVVATRETGDKFDWSKTWVAEMFLSGEESVRRAAAIERMNWTRNQAAR
jgi:predicted amidophosphoribosyltransferase